MAYEEHRALRKTLQLISTDCWDSISEAWDGVEDLQTFLDRAVTWNPTKTPITAAQVLANPQLWPDEQLRKKVRRLREQRTEVLRESDWTQLGDSVLPQQKKNQWKSYRQELRDLPQNFPDANDVIWPTEPTS